MRVTINIFFQSFFEGIIILIIFLESGFLPIVNCIKFSTILRKVKMIADNIIRSLFLKIKIIII